MSSAVFLLSLIMLPQPYLQLFLYPFQPSFPPLVGNRLFLLHVQISGAASFPWQYRLLPRGGLSWIKLLWTSLCGHIWSFLLGKREGVELRGRRVNVCFNFIRRCQTFFQIPHSLAQCMRVLIVPRPHQHVTMSLFTQMKYYLVRKRKEITIQAKNRNEPQKHAEQKPGTQEYTLLWFRLCDILERAKFTYKYRRLWLPKVGNGAEGWLQRAMRETGGIGNVLYLDWGAGVVTFVKIH